MLTILITAAQDAAGAVSAVGTVVWLVYLVAAVTFVLGLHLMRSPATARRGNLLSAAGMTAAIVVTFLLLTDPASGHAGSGIHVWAWVALALGLLVGGGAGAISARRVQMTAMPQLVSVFNAVGGGAAAVVAVVEFLVRDAAGTLGSGVTVAVVLDVIIGSVTFSGSIVAAGKLQGWISGAPISFTGSRAVAALSTVVALGVGVWLVFSPNGLLLAVVLVASLLFGVLMTLPIGGADMPVVISLLNAFTGLAVAMAGFVVNNQIMIVAGALVGASGTILTQQMAEAMNRSVLAIMMGGFGTGDAAAAGGVDGPGQEVRRLDVDDVAIQLAYAQKVIIVPGYGLAAAQAQREAGELGKVLQEHGITVYYAIHPVAGRMPGHMNVLLAEADVPYTQLKEMDEINPEFDTADVALVVGANDVTNPAARRPGNPISGMPILDVDHARSVVVIKRSLGHGYAGLDNELYSDPKTGMLFADAKKGLASLIAAVKTYVA